MTARSDIRLLRCLKLTDRPVRQGVTGNPFNLLGHCSIGFAVLLAPAGSRFRETQTQVRVERRVGKERATCSPAGPTSVLNLSRYVQAQASHVAKNARAVLADRTSAQHKSSTTATPIHRRPARSGLVGSLRCYWGSGTTR